MTFYAKKKKKKKRFTVRNCIPSLLRKFSKKEEIKKTKRKKKKNLEMMEKAICRHFLYTMKVRICVNKSYLDPQIKITARLILL